MEQVIRNIVQKLFPELANRTNLPKWGKVSRIPSAVSAGQLSTEEEPRYAVDVQLLDEHGQPDGPVYESVPLPVPFAGNNRGAFAFPPVGTRVLVQWVYGSPHHPVITGVYPLERHLPKLGETETLWQHSANTYLRSNEEESVDLRVLNKLRLGNAGVDLVAEVQRLADILASHTHPSVSKPIQSGQIADVASKVNQIKG